MRVNENIVISTPKVLLVPYDAHHVERYHEWMQNNELREATASDLLSLDEEYENQQSWRTAHDKLTFIVCQPVVLSESKDDITTSTIYAGENERMVGDVNLFLAPCDDGENENKPGENGDENATCGEIDIMIAMPEHRRKGLGEAAVRAFLQFLTRHHDGIMSEYSLASEQARPDGAAKNTRLKRLVAKISADNVGSIRLFESLGFRRDGEPNYFNEISLVFPFPPPLPPPPLRVGALPVMTTVNSGTETDSLGYREVVYDRSRLKGLKK
ncbi:hypothetical protein HD806DRAFT_95336 [Xylariaceae sp. AK1471]|nr:hypothetical protein HD806DRAFT_95336 [Xylariaceae sp. AK1471]